jgi:Peptidase family S41
MKKITLILLSMLLFAFVSDAQKTLTLAQQQEDFKIFKTGIQEMHAGLYWFITPKRFAVVYDSVYNTLKENTGVEEYYMKLRYCMAMLHHGHGSIDMTEKEGGVNYRMGSLPKTGKYLPFVLKYLNKRLFVTNNCSSNEQITNGSEILAINGEPVSKITAQLMSYVFANGRNVTFKYAMLDEYFQFHYLYQVLHPDADKYQLDIIPFKSKKKVTVMADAALPGLIADTYKEQTGKKISDYSNLVYYKLLDDKTKTGYLRFGSFSTYLVEDSVTKFPALLEKMFGAIKEQGIQNLIIDVRNNEGGDDTWQTAVTYFRKIEKDTNAGLAYMQSDKFTQAKYIARNNQNSMLLTAFEKNPYALIDKTADGRFKLKPQYTTHDTKEKPLKEKAYNGKIYLLQNGLTFSAGFAFAGKLKDLYKQDGGFIKVVGEDNGDDMDAGVGSGGWSLDLLLPNSKIKVNIPITGGGLDKPYSGKPVNFLDYKVIPAIAEKINGIDAEVEFVKKLISTETKK